MGTVHSKTVEARDRVRCVGRCVWLSPVRLHPVSLEAMRRHQQLVGRACNARSKIVQVRYRVRCVGKWA